MSSAPQIQTQEISDTDLDNVAGGISGAASLEAPLVGGIAGAVSADPLGASPLSGTLSGAVGGSVLGVAGLGSAATLSA